MSAHGKAAAASGSASSEAACRSAWGPPPSASMQSEACEELADVVREQVGRLGGRKVAATWHRCPAADVVEPFGPLARRGSLGDELVGEHRDRGGDGHEVVRSDGVSVPPLVVVVAH